MAYEMSSEKLKQIKQEEDRLEKAIQSATTTGMNVSGTAGTAIFTALVIAATATRIGTIVSQGTSDGL